MNWIVFAASLAAILALAGVAWWLRLGGETKALKSADDACAAAADQLPGFVATAAVLGSDRRSALVIGHAGRVAVLKAHGAHVAAREVRWHDVRAGPEGIVVETNDRRFGAVALPDVDVLDIRRAGGEAMAPRPKTA